MGAGLVSGVFLGKIGRHVSSVGGCGGFFLSGEAGMEDFFLGLEDKLYGSSTLS